MATQTFNATTFRTQFAAFANATRWPDATLSAKFDMATLYMSNADWWLLSGDKLLFALNCLTAHLLQIEKNIIGGNTGSGVVNSATIDKVSIALEAPPIKNAWQQWLSQTAYGLQLWAFLNMRGAGGFYVGGNCERSGFRKGGGQF